MTKTKSEIKTLIARNVFLPPEQKQEVLNANEAKQKDILPLLRKMDKDQTIYFRRALKRNPNLFADWGNKIIENSGNSAPA